MITNKINTILNNSQQGDIDYTICNYIKMNLKEVAFMSIEELARKSYVSKAKISKFIKKLGYDNYIAFKDDCLFDEMANSSEESLNDGVPMDSGVIKSF